MSKQEYTAKTGRKYRGDVLAYHVRQSFKPGEITPEKANEVGYDLASRWTKGGHAFIVATHTDKSHIHNHIIFDAVSLDCEKKYRNFWGSSIALRHLSDIICIENSLSIIENPKPNREHYGKWLENNPQTKEPTARQKLEVIISDVLSKNPGSFEVFIKLLGGAGCEVKRGTHISIKAPGQKKFIRLRSLSADFSEDAIRQKIAGKHEGPPVPVVISPPIPQRKSLWIDVQNSIKAQNSPGYERWAKTFNLKQAAKTLLFLQENGLDELEKLSEAAQAAKDDYGSGQSRIDEINIRLGEISELQKHIGVYIKTKDVYAERGSKKSYMLEVLTAQQNVRRFLGYRDSAQAQGHAHNR